MFAPLKPVCGLRQQKMNAKLKVTLLSWLLAICAIQRRHLLRAAFAGTLLFNVFLTSVVAYVLRLLPLSKRLRGAISLTVLQAAWRITLQCSPWLGSAPKGSTLANLREFDRQVALQPAGTLAAGNHFVLGNHTSFLDTIMTVSKAAASTPCPKPALWINGHPYALDSSLQGRCGRRVAT